jgi:hypothetical protein
MRIGFGANRPSAAATLVDRELTLCEMLADPIVIRLMRKDRVGRDEIAKLFAALPRDRLCRAA